MMTLIGGVDSHQAQLEIDAREEVGRDEVGGWWRGEGMYGGELVMGEEL